MLYYYNWSIISIWFALLYFKATVAAFAASEGHAHPRVVELPKTDEGLGFNVMGGKEQNSPIYISRIIPGNIYQCGYISVKNSNFSFLPISQF